MTLSVEDIVRARERDGGVVKPVGGYFLTTCPAHDDCHPSLTFGEGADGGAWIVCRTGCAARDVVAALGANGTAVPLDPAERERRRAEAEVARTLREANARSLHEQSLRHPDRDAALRYIAGPLLWDAGDLLLRDVGWTGERVVFPIASDDGVVTGCDVYAAPTTRARRDLGDEPKLRAHGTRGLWPAPGPPMLDVEFRPKGVLLLCEGAPAAATLLGCGFAAISYPSAVGFRREWATRIATAPFKRVLVLADADRPGRDAARTVAATLRDEDVDVRAIDLAPSRADGRDVADELREHHNPGDAGDWLVGRLAPFLTTKKEGSA